MATTEETTSMTYGVEAHFEDGTTKLVFSSCPTMSAAQRRANLFTAIEKQADAHPNMALLPGMRVSQFKPVAIKVTVLREVITD